LDHMGRFDDQIKLKGFRVELDGVSAAMQTCPGVLRATTLLIDSELWGFVTPSTIDTTLLREAVAKIQPSYAVPSHFLALDDFPCTKNGKVDKRSLQSLVLSNSLSQDVTPCLSECSSPSSSDNEELLTPSSSRHNSLPSSDIAYQDETSDWDDLPEELEEKSRVQWEQLTSLPSGGDLGNLFQLNVHHAKQSDLHRLGLLERRNIIWAQQ